MLGKLSENNDQNKISDSIGNLLQVGTKLKNIRLMEGHHKIDCKINGISAINLKSKFATKA